VTVQVSMFKLDARAFRGLATPRLPHARASTTVDGPATSRY
jgi:hypothetical protein